MSEAEKLIARIVEDYDSDYDLEVFRLAKMLKRALEALIDVEDRCETFIENPTQKAIADIEAIAKGEQ